jgi:hypothetical protein
MIFLRDPAIDVERHRPSFDVEQHPIFEPQSFNARILALRSRVSGEQCVRILSYGWLSQFGHDILDAIAHPDRILARLPCCTGVKRDGDKDSHERN